MIIGYVALAVASGILALLLLWQELGAVALLAAPAVISAAVLLAVVLATARREAVQALALGAALGFVLGLGALYFNAPAAIFVWLIRYGVFG